ncbi:MAG: metal-dependent hydrolase [Patescibacteria group bacterium]
MKFMLFAHAPLGFLTVRATRRWWSKFNLSKRQQRGLYIAGGLGGIFPDIDLFYFYLVNASVNHRQLWTHGILPYLLVLLIGFILVSLSSKRPTSPPSPLSSKERGDNQIALLPFPWLGERVGDRGRYLGLCLLMFVIGVYTHLFADCITGRIVLLYPFSNLLYGFNSWSWYEHSILASYSLTTNYTVELLVFIILGYLFVKRSTTKIIYIIVSIILFVSVTSGLIWLDKHTYKTNGIFVYSDIDNDGILNVQDLDIDGDGINNSNDNNADNNNINNREQLNNELPKILGSLYDYSNGGFIQIPLRLGLVNDLVLIERAYTNIGMSFSSEMGEDFKNNPSGYISNPKDYRFTDNPQNWQTWLQHQQKLLPATILTQAQPFDIIFFQSGHVALYYPWNNQPAVIEINKKQPFTSVVSLNEVIKQEGQVSAFGKILP